MEKQQAILRKWSPTNKSICLEIEGSETWYNITDTVQNVVKKIKFDSKVEVKIEGNRNVTYIKAQGVITPEDEDSDTTEGIDGFGQSTKRMSALKNATNLAIAKGGDALNDEQVLAVAAKFLVFLGN